MLNVHNVSVSIGAKDILSEVSFKAHAGEVVALIGPNGAGKSTLLSAICADVSLSSGQVEFNGISLSSLSARELAQKRAVLLQKTEVSFPYSVEEVVAMGRTPWKGTSAAQEDEDIIQRCMRITEVEHMALRDITTLSGGESGRAHLARIFAQSTELILLDEPTAALDILHQEQTLKNARAFAQQGATVVVVLHDLDVAGAYADSIVLLNRGKVIAQGSPEQVCTSQRLSEVYGHPIEVLRHPSNGRLLVLPERHES
ncbi:heme ABC transporter ATP-binding protein [Rothia sp. CCM 9418]|uniref:heme ABC transporter ATP-binding protein n=1 Tax=Rothia sp. CCM 9418 TaxID=3402661 RepID=UPI003AE01552